MAQKEKYNNWERFYQKLNMIFHGIIATSLIPFAWVFLETQKEFPEGPLIIGTNATVIKVVLVIASAGILGYSRVFRQKASAKSAKKTTVKEKLNAYLSVKIRHYAILEIAAIIALIGLYLTKDQLFSLVYVVVLFMFSLERPVFDRVAREIGMKEKDLLDWASKSEDSQNP